MPLRLPNSLTDVQNLAPPSFSPIAGDLVRNAFEPQPKPLLPPKYEKQKYDTEASLSNALASIRRKGIAKQNRYIVIATLPNCMMSGDLQRWMTIGYTKGEEGEFMRAHGNCEAAEFPGIQIATQEQMLYAIPEKMPYQMMYEEFTLVYRVDNDMREKKYFDSWLNGIKDPVTGNINYKTNYTADIEIIQLDMSNRDVYGMKFIEAFPVSMSPLQLAYDAQNTYHRLSVTFAYKKYVTFGENTKIPDDVAFIQAKLQRKKTLFDRAMGELGKLGQSYIGTEIVKKSPIGNVPGIGSVSDVSAKIFGLQ